VTRWQPGMVSVVPEAEKITINMNVVDLGKIDLLVSEGFYANRTDFIRTAIRNQLDRHDDEVKHSVGRRQMAIGVLHYDRRDLEQLKATGSTLTVAITGLFSLAHDVPPELAREVISSLRVIGVFRASQPVKDALADRTR
jgi:Arc/MetJ-type ribon-helix-helix transcriptional regulator